MHVDREHGEDQARQPADDEQADEAHGEQEGRVERDLALIERRRPIVDLDAGRHGDDEAEEGEHRARIHRLAGDEHVVAPDQEADDRDGDRGTGDELVAEHRLARRGGDQLADDAERRQHHDVDGRVAVEPEQMLVEQRIAAERGVEDAQAEQPLRGDQHQRDRQDRRRQHQDDRGRVMRPDEERQPSPASCPEQRSL